MSRFVILEGHDCVGTTTLTNLMVDKYMVQKRKFQLSNKIGIYDAINEEWNAAPCANALNYDQMTPKYLHCGKEDLKYFKAEESQDIFCIADSNGILRMPSYISVISPLNKLTNGFQELYDLRWDMPDFIEVIIILCNPKIRRERVINKINKNTSPISWDDRLALDNNNHYILERMDHELCNSIFERFPSSRILDTSGKTEGESLYELEDLLGL